MVADGVDVAIVVPTYNERETVVRLLRELSRLEIPTVRDLVVFVVDDSSTDGTTEAVSELEREGWPVRLIVREGRSGLGSAVQRGLREALDQGFDVYVTMDADLSHPVEAIPRMVRVVLRTGGFVVGSRYVEGGRVVEWPLRRLVMSLVANGLARKVLDLELADVTSGFRAFDAEAADVLSGLVLLDESYSFQVQSLHAIAKMGETVVEHPISFRGRGGGRSKLGSTDVLNFLKTLLSISRNQA